MEIDSPIPPDILVDILARTDRWTETNSATHF